MSAIEETPWNAGEEPTPVWLVAVDDPTVRLSASVFVTGGYDCSILEGSLEGEEPTGMFLGCSDPRYNDSGYTFDGALKDSEAEWDLDGRKFRLVKKT